jgi:hypothetical protein
MLREVCSSYPHTAAVLCPSERAALLVACILCSFAFLVQRTQIMIINIFIVYDKATPHTENIRGLNLAVVKITTVRVTKLPL